MSTNSFPAQLSVALNLRRTFNLVRKAPALLLVIGLACSSMAWADIQLPTFIGIQSNINSTLWNTPRGVASDSSGNIYVGNNGGNNIIKITAGTQATSVYLSGPVCSPAITLGQINGLAMDSSNNLYFANESTNQIIVWSTTTNTCVAYYNTAHTPFGIALDSSNNIFVAEVNTVEKITAGATSGSTGTTIISGLYPYLYGIAVAPVTNTGLAAGDVLVAEWFHGYVYRYTAASNYATQSTLISGLNEGIELAFDLSNNLLVSTYNGSQLIKYQAPNYTASSVMMHLASSRGVVEDPSGNIFMTSDNGTVAELSQSFAPVAVGSTSATLSAVYTIYPGVNIGAFNVLDTGLSGLEFNSASGSTCTTGLYSSTTNCTVNFTFTPAYPGTHNGAIQVIQTTSNNILNTGYFGGTGTGPNAIIGYNGTGSTVSTFNTVVGGVTVTEFVNSLVDAEGNIYAGDPGSLSLFKFTRTGPGSYTGAVVPLSGVSISNNDSLNYLTIDGAGTLYSNNSSNSAISIVNGVVSTVNLGTFTLQSIKSLSAGPDGTLYISDSIRQDILVVPPNGGTPHLLANFPSGDTPWAVIADSSGTVYYEAYNSHTIKSITASGTVSTIYTLRSGARVDTLNFDANGNLLFADSYNGGLYSVNPSTGTRNSLPVAESCGVNSFMQAGNGDYVSSSVACGNIVVFQGNPATSTSLNFLSSDETVQSTDSPKTVTLYNEGNAALVVAVPGTGNNPSIATSFAYDSASSCPQLSTTSSAYNLAAGANCTYSVDFIPAALGSINGSLVLTDNNLNASSSTQTISLSGTGLAPPGDTTSTTVAVVPTSLVVGQRATTITATIADTQSGHTSTVPTGTVSTYTDTLGGTVTNLIASPATLSSGKVILSSVLLSGVGTHTITANYVGVTGSFLTSSGSTTVAVGKAPVTVAGPTTQPVLVVVNQLGAIPVTVTGQYAGTGIPLPTGTISYTIVNSSSTTVASGTPTLTAGTGNAIASIPVANTLAAGTYTVTVTYSGDANFAIPASSTAITLQVGQIQPVINWTQPSAITYGTSLSGILNATASYTVTIAVHQANALPQTPPLTVAGTYVYTATPTGGTAATVTATTVLAAGSYTLNVNFTPTDTTTYKTATGSVTLTVNKATPGVVLTSNSNPVLVQNSITLTATVSSSISTPTGTVSFVDGSTAIGSGTVNSSGVATYSTAALAVGTHTITAVYSGDTNFLTITSGALTQGVQDFNLVISASGGTTGATSVTALPGGVAVFTFTLSPVGTTTFPATVTLSASGLPAGATYTFSPATLAAGTGSTTVTLTIQLAQVSAVHLQPLMHHSAQPEVLAQNRPTTKLPYLALALLLLPFAGRMRRASKKLGRMLPLLLLLIVGLAATAGLSGCTGLNSGYFGQAPTTYTITVTGTSGTLVHSTSVTLTVQ